VEGPPEEGPRHCGPRIGTSDVTMRGKGKTSSSKIVSCIKGRNGIKQGALWEGDGSFLAPLSKFWLQGDASLSDLSCTPPVKRLGGTVKNW